jgi:AcrR family transcriptional regulator
MEKNDTLLKLKEKERETRQELIIAAARTVFGSKTYDRVSMAEIAKAAGIAKSSIYTYFPSQESLFVEIAVRDTNHFTDNLAKQIGGRSPLSLERAINFFLDYYIENEAQWRMITHFALYGNKSNASVDKLDRVSRRLMDQFTSLFETLGYTGNTRILAHTLFSSLSGTLIAFRKYPGRSEAQKIAHMKRIGRRFEKMFGAIKDS